MDQQPQKPKEAIDMANNTKPKATDQGTVGHVTIAPPKMQRMKFRIIGIAPYVQLSFSGKAINQIREKQEAGHKGKKGAKRDARDFNADYEAAAHRSTDGWYGIPAAAFRNAMVSACRIVGFQMTKAKLAVFVEADGIDRDGKTPLVKLAGKPEMIVDHVRNANGVADLRARALWREWSADVTIRWDADMFDQRDVANLLARVGLQVGIGEGRPDSKASTGMGWGLFKLDDKED